MADKITSIGKSKEKPKTKEKPEEIYILPKKDNKLLITNYLRQIIIKI